MEDYGLVSIVMPSYNGEKYIKGTIKSVQEQTYKKWELLIVDDCSKDQTEQIVKSINDTRIHFYKNQTNSGAAISRNRALREAKGRWIAFLDSDDIWYPQKLEMQLQFMMENNYKFTYTDYKIIHPNTEEDIYIYTGPNRVTKRRMWRYCYFSTITVIYDREYVGLIQIEDLKKNNDYAMWLKVIEKTDCYRFPHCLSVYCKRENSISSGSKFKLIKHHYILFRKACHKNSIIALMYTARNLVYGIHKKLYYRKRADK